jgi:Family of unknown function (DUF5723)
MKYILKLFVIPFFLISFQVVSQQYLGIIGSNYAGTNSLFANPANIVDTRHKIYINLASVDFFAGNNAVKWNAPFSFLTFASNSFTNKKVTWQAAYLKQTDNNHEKNMNVLLDVKGPAFLYTIDNKQSFAISSRGRGGATITNVSPELAVLLQNGQNSPLIRPIATNQNMAMNMNIFAEIGFTFAKDISFNREEAIKVGITVKRIIGLGNYHTIAKNVEYNLVTPISLTNPILNIGNADLKYGNSMVKEGIDAFNLSPGYWLGKPSPGRGIGLDVGLSYEYRPDVEKYNYNEKGVRKLDPTQNKYKYKLGVSIIDIGSVKFDNPAYVSNYEASISNKLIYKTSFRKLKSTNRLVDDINTINGPIPLSGSFVSKLPMTFQTYFDYKIKENVYVYGTWVQNLHSDNSLGMRMPSLISVVPRFEKKNVEFSMPVSLVNDYQLLTIGIAGRVGPFFIGSDNLQGLFSIANPRGMDIFGGVNIPIFHKMPRLSTNCSYDKVETGFRKYFRHKSRKVNKW